MITKLQQVAHGPLDSRMTKIAKLFFRYHEYAQKLYQMNLLSPDVQDSLFYSNLHHAVFFLNELKDQIEAQYRCSTLQQLYNLKANELEQLASVFKQQQLINNITIQDFRDFYAAKSEIEKAIFQDKTHETFNEELLLLATLDQFLIQEIPSLMQRVELRNSQQLLQ